MIYRVVLFSGYKEMRFDFSDKNQAINFATSAFQSRSLEQASDVEVTVVLVDRRKCDEE